MKVSRMNRKGRVIYTVLADVLLQFVVVLLALTAWLNVKWTTSKQVAQQVPELKGKVVELSDEVRQGKTKLDKAEKRGGQLTTTIDGLKSEIHGLQGLVEQGRIDLTQAMKTGGDLKSIIQSQEEEIDELRGEVGKLTDENGVFRSRLRSGAPLTVVVLIDVTGSMAEPIAELQSSMATLFEFMPNASKDFRVGIVAFRNGVFKVYPTTAILPSYEDGGKSQKSALTFLNELKAEQSFTDHLPAFRKALSMFNVAGIKPNKNRKERLVFMGDVGTSELDQKLGYSAIERDAKNKIVRGLETWVSTGDRAVEALFVESAFTAQDPSADESRDWFKTIGKVSPKSAFYTDSNALLRAILHATFD